ncbi:hypothetical protein KDA_42840 [Dictyobacter alpinus]|uniref:Uncharacterized protein n=1 Tax=Dictyobacter alpinus TaxID=2014873 RepID=A0A402BBX3_9CHLR|nr:hypothetical protein [Dictyobacter alpinus]GCE28800.1 hypothetical protein KDA_42840 [Dictyobacter alpinus]
MPLDSRKIEHIQSILTRSWGGRKQTVVFVYQNGSGYSYQAIEVLWRPRERVDWQIQNKAGAEPQRDYDTLLQAPLGTSFNGVVLIADTTTASASAVQAARKYQVIEAIPIGMPVGGTRIHAYLRHLV